MKRLLLLLLGAALALSSPFAAQAQCTLPDNTGTIWGDCEDCDDYDVDINIWIPDPSDTEAEDMHSAFMKAVASMNECLRDGEDGPKFDVNVSDNPGGGDINVHIFRHGGQPKCGSNRGKAGNGDSWITLYTHTPSVQCPRSDLTYALHELIHSMGHGRHTLCPHAIMHKKPSHNFSSVPDDVCAVIAQQWVSPQVPDENDEPGPISPLVLDMDGNGIATSHVKLDPVTYDLDGDGFVEQVGWTSRQTQDAFLWIDLNGDGIPNNGGELFGNASVLPGGVEAGDGIAALAAYDSNGDEKITPEDDVWPRLLLWNDRSHDGMAASGEIARLSSTRISGISLRSERRRWTDENGNHHTHSSTYWVKDGNRLWPRLIEDIWFQQLPFDDRRR